MSEVKHHVSTVKFYKKQRSQIRIKVSDDRRFAFVGFEIRAYHHFGGETIQFSLKYSEMSLLNSDDCFFFFIPVLFFTALMTFLKGDFI